MFKSDAGLFLNANNNLGIAKSYIYECKRIISELGLIADNDDSSVLKSSIEDCDIDTLVTKVENTKNNLLKIDQNFATKYMSLLEKQISNESLDVSNMTDEQYQEYSMYDREYHQSLLFTLEQYEAQGNLPDELKDDLAYERLISKSYDIQDKMSLVSESSDEYLGLFEQYGTISKQIIQANPNLTDDEKTKLLSSYDTEYNTKRGKIETAVSKRKERDVVNLVNNNPGAVNYGNGLGRAAERGYDSAAFIVPGSQCQLPDNWNSMTKAERTSWAADTVKLDPTEFSSGCYKITIDRSIIPSDGIVPSTSHTQGANGAWAPTMTPMGSDVFEAVIPRVEDIVDIDPNVQIQLNQATSGQDATKVMAIFDQGLKTGDIKPRDGVTITHLY